MDMINVTEHALEKIQDAVKDKGDNPAIRVYVAGVG
jgi:Fe-S cluster assembly iron-binding protein IscA